MVIWLLVKLALKANLVVLHDEVLLPPVYQWADYILPSQILNEKSSFGQG